MSLRKLLSDELLIIKLRKNFHVLFRTTFIKLTVYENFLTTKNSGITVQQNFLLWEKHKVKKCIYSYIISL